MRRTTSSARWTTSIRTRTPAPGSPASVCSSAPMLTCRSPRVWSLGVKTRADDQVRLQLEPVLGGRDERGPSGRPATGAVSGPSDAPGVASSHRWLRTSRTVLGARHARDWPAKDIASQPAGGGNLSRKVAPVAVPSASISWGPVDPPREGRPVDLAGWRAGLARRPGSHSSTPVWPGRRAVERVDGFRGP